MESNIFSKAYKGYTIIFSSYNAHIHFWSSGKVIQVTPDRYQDAIDYIDRIEFEKEFMNKIEDILND